MAAASSLDQERTVGCAGDVIGVRNDWLLMSSMLARTTPVRKLSISLASWVSCGVGANVMADTDGVETHDGGPKESEYPGRMFVIILSSVVVEGAGLGSVLMGESCLLEKVSGMTWSLPGI